MKNRCAVELAWTVTIIVIIITTVWYLPDISYHYMCLYHKDTILSLQKISLQEYYLYKKFDAASISMSIHYFQEFNIQ